MDSSAESASAAQTPITPVSFVQSVTNDPEGALNTFQQMQNQNAAMAAQIASLTAQVAAITTPSTSAPSPTDKPPPPSNSASPPPSFDPALLASIVAQAVSQVTQNQSPAPASAPASVSAPPPRLSEKLPDIDKYEGERDKLDAWEQALLQKMHTNHDRYPTDVHKIAYAESRLTIGKRAHTLMSPYRVNGICSILVFSLYLRSLRDACGNPFEAEDARAYLRNTLRQDKMTFPEYLLLFVAKKARANMDDGALIECLRLGVNFSTQQAAIAWRSPEGREPTTYDEYVACFTAVDNKMQHLKHLHPRATVPVPASKPKPSAPTSGPSAKTASSSTPVPVVATVPLSAGEPMDLDAAMAAVKGKSLDVPGVRDICNKWQLCYYCKESHKGKTAKDCPNKKKSSNLRIVDLDNTASIDGGVPVPPGKT